MRQYRLGFQIPAGATPAAFHHLPEGRGFQARSRVSKRGQRRYRSRNRYREGIQEGGGQSGPLVGNLAHFTQFVGKSRVGQCRARDGAEASG
jgi:hypothetical protein